MLLQLFALFCQNIQFVFLYSKSYENTSREVLLNLYCVGMVLQI